MINPRVLIVLCRSIYLEMIPQQPIVRQSNLLLFRIAKLCLRRSLVQVLHRLLAPRLHLVLRSPRRVPLTIFWGCLGHLHLLHPLCQLRLLYLTHPHCFLLSNQPRLNLSSQRLQNCSRMLYMKKTS